MGPTFNMVYSDVLKWAAAYKGPKYHALLGDPPYHLTDPRDPRRASPSASQRQNRSKSAGFMGKKWDGGEIAFNPETWAAFASHLHPGAFGMAFASSRGWHRLAVAIEDAGLIIHPSIFGWCFASGFPKATRIDTAIDKAAGAEGKWKVNGTPTAHSDKVQQVTISTHTTEPKAEYTPATALARAWSGHRYGLQAIKPALEPIIVFQKPYEGRPVECITQTGAGALNIDGGRIPADNGRPLREARRNEESDANRRAYAEGLAGSRAIGSTDLGRWPANFYLGESRRYRLYSLMDSTPRDVRTPIKEYFDGYSEVYSVWEVEEDLPVEIETEPGPLLQSSLLREVDKRERSGRQTSDEGEKAHGRGAAQDERECAENKVLSESETIPECERMVHQQGVQVRGSDGRRKREVRLNGQERPSVRMERDICARASASDGQTSREAAEAERDCTSYQRREDGQQDRESGIAPERSAHAGAPKGVQRAKRLTAGERRTAETTCLVAEIDIPECWKKYFNPTRFSLVYSPAKRLDEQSGETAQGHWTNKREIGSNGIYGGGGYQDLDEGRKIVDSGGASRFFFTVREQIDEADPVYYEPKASRTERDAGLDSLPAQIMRRVNAGGLENDPRWSPYECKNHHPTIKPLDLCRWLATLLLPPAEYAPRRILIPFAGVGSECVGAMQAGWDEITGIEGDMENQGYCQIAEARFEYWAQREGKREPRAEVLKPQRGSDDYSDLPLFSSLA